MAKQIMTAERSFELRQILQMATLEALIASRRWEPGDLIFQGGTSLHLAHGSPRFSEDLDFLIKSTIGIKDLVTGIRHRLANALWLPHDLALSVTDGKDKNNPHAFDVVLGSPSTIGSVRVKVELYQAPGESMDELSVRVMQMRSSTSTAQRAAPLVMVETLNESEIYADKIFAIGGRPYIKARDMFDLYWLKEQRQQKNLPPHQFTIEQLENRLALYPNQDPEKWLDAAVRRRDSLPAQQEKIEADLAQWLPPMFRLNGAEMITDSVMAINDGIEVMRSYLAGERSADSAPSADAAEPVEPDVENPSC